MAAQKRRLTSKDKWGIIFSLIGILDAGYLSWMTFTNNTEKCLPGFGNCSTVTLSKYSRLADIPIAYIGLIVYMVIFSLYLIQLNPVNIDHIKRYIIFGITFAGFLFSIYLTYVQLGILNTYCPFCVLSGLTMTLLFVVSTSEMIRVIL